MTTSYLDALRMIGLPAVERGIWASVGTLDRDFGWKLHLSSVQGEAGRLIERIGPLLRDRAVPFKVAATDEILGELNEGTFGATQVGKFATLYPRGDRECVELAHDLLALTHGFCGPRIIADLALGNIVHARYGHYNVRVVRDRTAGGAHEPPPAPSEAPVPCEAIANPFAGWPVRSDSSSPGGGLIGPGFLRTSLLAAHAGGAVSLAMDLRSPGLGVAVLKEGRGRDMWDRLRHQQAMGEALAGIVRVPAPRTLFEQGDSLFLALDYIEGRDFSDRGAGAFRVLDEAGQRALLKDLTAVADTLRALHDAGVVHRDLSPRNVRIGIDGKAWLIDLEMAHHVGEQDAPFQRGTMGFASPEQQRGWAAAFTDDIYGFGCLLANALTGCDTRRMSLADDGALAERLAGLSGAPRAIVDICARMLSAAPERRPGLDEIRAMLTGQATAELLIGNGIAHFLAGLQHDEIRRHGASPPIDPDMAERSLAWAAEGRVSILQSVDLCR